jgi:hypothetical protein
VIKIAFDAIESLFLLGPDQTSEGLSSRVGHCGAEIELRSALQNGHFSASSAILLAQWGQSLVRIPVFRTNDLPSFGQKLTVSSYSVEHWGHCFIKGILYATGQPVKRLSLSDGFAKERFSRSFLTCPDGTLEL